MSGHEFASGFLRRNKKFTGIFLEKIPEPGDIGAVRKKNCSLIDNLNLPCPVRD